MFMWVTKSHISEWRSPENFIYTYSLNVSESRSQNQIVIMWVTKVTYNEHQHLGTKIEVPENWNIKSTKRKSWSIHLRFPLGNCNPNFLYPTSSVEFQSMIEQRILHLLVTAILCMNPFRLRFSILVKLCIETLV